MRLISLIFFVVLGYGEDSFITKEEYAKMLYHNPRGIGCHKCHGEYGKGEVLGRYKESNRTIIIKAPNITNLSFKKFYEALTNGKHRLMPHYFLTLQEIKTLYFYLKSSKHKSLKR